MPAAAHFDDDPVGQTQRENVMGADGALERLGLAKSSALAGTRAIFTDHAGNDYTLTFADREPGVTCVELTALLEQDAPKGPTHLSISYVRNAGDDATLLFEDSRKLAGKVRPLN